MLSADMTEPLYTGFKANPEVPKTDLRTDGKTLQNHLSKGLFPGLHLLAVGRTEISRGKRISLRQ